MTAALRYSLRPEPANATVGLLTAALRYSLRPEPANATVGLLTAALRYSVGSEPANATVGLLTAALRYSVGPEPANRVGLLIRRIDRAAPAGCFQRLAGRIYVLYYPDRSLVGRTSTSAISGVPRTGWQLIFFDVNGILTSLKLTADHHRVSFELRIALVRGIGLTIRCLEIHL